MISRPVKTLITRAETLANTGFHRRSVQLWRTIAIHPDASDSEREQAWRQVLATQTLTVEAQREAEQKKHQATAMKKQQLEKDRLHILDLFSQGYTPIQVRTMTGRSRSFVSTCRKKRPGA